MDRGTLGLIVIAIFFAGYTWRKKHQETMRSFRKERIKNIWEEVQELDPENEEVHRLEINYREFLKDKEDIDETTWNDLEMNGVFAILNHTCSSMGELSLYNMLRKPFQTEEELLRRESLIQTILEENNIREEKQADLSYIGKGEQLTIYACKDILDRGESFSIWIHVLWLAAFIGILTATIVLRSEMLIIWIFVVFGIGIAKYTKDRGKIVTYLMASNQIGKMLKMCTLMSKETGNGEIDALLRPLQKAKNMEKKYRIFLSMIGSMGISDNDIVMDYIRMITHCDLFAFAMFLRMVENEYEQLVEMYESVGYLDAMCAIAKFRHDQEKKEGQSWCIPQFINENKMEVRQCYYPLIKKPICNDFISDRSALITGSNATGKSTFLRTVALNALLAQTIHTVCAKSYQAPFYKILTSMSLKDNVLTNESYYMMEIKSVKRILDTIESGERVLCCIDELLRGTNTVERIAAASEILESIAKEKITCIVASHDIELSYILEDTYKNYHFQEYVTEESMYSDYILYEGRSYTRNAVKLLKFFGYSQDIVTHARERVEEYLETGQWN